MVTDRVGAEPVGGREPPASGRPGFAHASEAEFARILDFYQVEWSYEPHVYPILWSLDGDVLESFAPDFYLPELDLYVEMTTLRQKLVRKKNRKLRRLRELYPDIRIKLFYARDFRMLLLKFGRLALVDELTGTTGQATPPRTEAVLAAAGADDDNGGGEIDLDLVDATGTDDDAAHDAGPDEQAGIPVRAGPRDERRRRRSRRRRRRDAAAGTETAPPGAA